jgi:ATP-dependent RNA helicase RhlE
VSPEEEGDVARIERAIGKRLPRITLPGFDYRKKAAEKLEIPIHARFAAMRAQRRGAHRPPTRAFGARRGPSRGAQPRGAQYEPRRTGTR